MGARVRGIDGVGGVGGAAGVREIDRVGGVGGSAGGSAAGAEDRTGVARRRALSQGEPDVPTPSEVATRRRAVSFGSMLAAAAVLALSASACGGTDTPTGPPGGSEVELRVAFVGNSLTYTNNLPSVFAALAASAGLDVATTQIANPNWSLEEHWRGGTPAGIRSLQPDLVVMQQGPSTLLSSREHLLAWGDSMARVVREAGAVPAFMMVWPPNDPQYSFGAVLASYRAVAEAQEAMFVPAGVAWLEAWKVDPGLQLWGSDRFHPSLQGTVAAAMTLIHQLCGSIGPIQPSPVAVPADVLGLLSEAAARAAGSHGLDAREGALAPEC